MAESWELAGYGSDGQAFEIEPGINVWEYAWHRDSGGPVQIGESPTGPFEYHQVYYIDVAGRKIVFAASDLRMGAYVFYRFR